MGNDNITKFSFDGKCPYCGSNNVINSGMGHRVTNNPEANEVTNFQYKCNKCERFFRQHKKD